jgi:cytochrome P450
MAGVDTGSRQDHPRQGAVDCSRLTGVLTIARVFVTATDPNSPVPRAPGAAPLLGHSVQLLRNPMRFLRRMRDLGDVVVISVGREQVVVVNDPVLIRQIMVVDSKKFDKGALFEKASAVLGNGLITSSGEFHLRQRRLMQPAFHRSRFPFYMEIMDDVARAKADSWRNDQLLDVPQEMHEITFRTTARTLFSTRLAAPAVEELNVLLPTFLGGLARRTFSPFPFLEKIPTPANRRFNAAVNRMRELVYTMIEAYRADGSDHGDFMSLLLFARHADTGQPMPDAHVYDEAVTLIMAGTETSASMLAWTFYELARHPEIATRVYAEVDAVRGGEQVRMRDLESLPYTQQVLREVMRLYPLALIPRRAVTEVTIGARRYPPRTQFFISPHALHHDPQFYPAPDTFDPDRWSPERMADMRRDIYLPFGDGVRRCMGDSFALVDMTIVVCAVASRWQLSLQPGQAVKEKMQGTTRPDKLAMIATRRSAGEF